MRHPILLLLLLATTAMASLRGSAPQLDLNADPTLLDPGEAYTLTLDVRQEGFVYIYSVDDDGYVQLLYPVLPEDGRGRVQKGEHLVLDPVFAGQLSGLETLIAVHTREFRRIKSTRHHFLAPDPNDIEDINARLTRSNRDIRSFTRCSIDIFGTSAPDLEDIGFVVHEHHYNYWCDYCDCWHMPCTHNHCYCGWEVVHHYHNHFHFSHCGFWGGWHTWWNPPVVYIFIQGGSPWDYDTREYRNHRVWRRYRGYSTDWRREVRPHMRDRQAQWSTIQERSLDAPRRSDVRLGFSESPALRAAPSTPRYPDPASSSKRGKRLSTEDFEPNAILPGSNNGSSKRSKYSTKKAPSVNQKKEKATKEKKTEKKREKTVTKKSKKSNNQPVKKKDNDKKPSPSSPKKAPRR
jgi:hypothetical protein